MKFFVTWDGKTPMTNTVSSLKSLQSDLFKPNPESPSKIYNWAKIINLVTLRFHLQIITLPQILLKAVFNRTKLILAM